MAAFEKEWFLAAAKSSFQGYWYILSVNFPAISVVRSKEPVSTMIISSTRSCTLFRQRSRVFSSFFTIIQRLIVAIGHTFLSFFGIVHAAVPAKTFCTQNQFPTAHISSAQLLHCHVHTVDQSGFRTDPHERKSRNILYFDYKVPGQLNSLAAFFCDVISHIR